MNYGAQLFIVARTADSLVQSRAAIGIDPSSAEGYINAGAALLTMRRYAEAAPGGGASGRADAAVGQRTISARLRSAAAVARERSGSATPSSRVVRPRPGASRAYLGN